VAVSLVTLAAAPAAAQEPPLFIPPPPPRAVFVNVNGGLIAQSQEFTQAADFILYGEAGSFEAQHAIKGGPVVDVAAGVRVAGNMSLGVAYSRRSTHTRAVALTALVPDPLFTNRHRDATGIAAGLEHGERAVHVQASWRLPVTVEFDVTLFVGPTIFTVDEEVVEGVSVTEGASGTASVSGIARSRQRRTAAGFHFGFDTAYMFTRHAGAGAMLRYSRGWTELELPPGSTESDITLHPGGFELAAGLRLRF
jgi:hypothetical protein